MGGGRGKSKSKSKSKKKKKLSGRERAQQMAKKNIAKHGGTASAAKANKAAGKAKAKAKHTASQAAKKAAPSKGASISKGTTGIGPVKSGKTYAKAVSNATNAPTKKTSGVGPVVSGKEYAASLKKSPPKIKDGTKVASAFSAGSGLFGDDIDVGDGVFRTKDQIIKMRDNPQNFNLEPGSRLFKQIQEAGKGLVTAPGGDKIAAAGDLGGLGISPTPAPSYFSIKSPESFGAPSQAAVDKAAGITAGGLNIGGGGFTPTKPSGSTSRAILDRPASSFNFGPTVDRFGRGDEYARNINEFGMRFGATPEARADAYDRSLTGRKNLFDNATDESGPVASGDAYARGLEVSRFGSPMNIIKTGLNAFPGVNLRLQNDKSLADSVGRAPTLKRRGGGGGARLPVAPLTPEEILLPEVAQAAPVYQQAIPEQTGVDPNRLLQIQQEAYARAFNPYNPLTVGGFNPMFRFFNRRGGARRGSFRRTFRRN